jgi:hypothetical protein
MHLNKGNHWKGKGGNGGVRGVQYTANLGQEWTGIRATTQRRDFQVSKKGFPDRQGWDFQVKEGLPERDCGHAPLCIYCANKRLCLGYK